MLSYQDLLQVLVCVCVCVCVGRPPDAWDAEDSDDVTNTVVIAVCSVVAYLGLIIGLTIYCSLRLVRRLNERKRNTPPPAPANGHGQYSVGL